MEQLVRASLVANEPGDVRLRDALTVQSRLLLRQIRRRLAQSVSEGELAESTNVESLRV